MALFWKQENLIGSAHGIECWTGMHPLQNGFQVGILRHNPAYPAPGLLHQQLNVPLSQFGECDAHIFLEYGRLFGHRGAYPGSDALAEAGRGIYRQQPGQFDQRPDKQEVQAPQQAAQEAMLPREFA